MYNMFSIIDICNLIVSIASLICCVVTVIIACKAQKAIVSNHAKSKQVEKMAELVEYLNNSRLEVFVLTGGGFETNRLMYNIFELAGLDNNKETDVSCSLCTEEYDGAEVFLSANSNFIIDIDRYLYDGFVPQEVALCLKKFHILLQGEEIDFRQIVKRKAICISTNGKIIDGVNIKVKMICCNSIKSWCDLKTCAKELTMSISSWFKKNGIKCWNMRIDYENRTKGSI